VTNLLEPGDAGAAYKAKILSYQAGEDVIALQAAAPQKLASLVEGLSPEELSRRPAPDLALLRSLRSEEWEMFGVHAERGA
jgi:hypothetical protein